MGMNINVCICLCMYVLAYIMSADMWMLTIGIIYENQFKKKNEFKTFQIVT